MATVSSMLELQDGFTRTIDNSINAMTRLTEAINTLNRSVSMPQMEKPFNGMRPHGSDPDKRAARPAEQ